jgi:glucokinase
MPNNEFVLGVDLGGTKVLSAVIDSAGAVLARAKRKTQKLKTGEDVLRSLLESAREALAKSGLPTDALAAVGVGSPGPLDPQTGVIEFTPNMPFRNFPLRDRIQEDLGRPTFINNDVSLGTYGEWKLGAGVGVRDMVGIFVGTGTGGGLILNGELYEGFNRVAGEIGHIVVQLHGPRCGCGNRGCLEASASRTAISRMIAQAVGKGEKSLLADYLKGDPPSVRSSRLARAYAQGDKLARKVLDHVAEVLGVGIGSVINLLSPEIVVVGGGVIEALGAQYVKKIEAIASEWAFPVNMRNVRVAPAILGDDAIIQGAAAYARAQLPLPSTRLQAPGSGN